jgi:hypothetical protein
VDEDEREKAMREVKGIEKRLRPGIAAALVAQRADQTIQSRQGDR